MPLCLGRQLSEILPPWGPTVGRPPTPPSSAGNKNSSCLAFREEGAAPKPACETLAPSQRNLGGGGEESSRGRWHSAESSPQTSSPAWLRASLGSPGREASHTGHCVHPGSLDLTSNSPKKEIPMGYGRNLSGSAFIHPSIGLALPHFPSSPSSLETLTDECLIQLAPGFILGFCVSLHKHAFMAEPWESQTMEPLSSAIWKGGKM